MRIWHKQVFSWHGSFEFTYHYRNVVNIRFKSFMQYVYFQNIRRRLRLLKMKYRKFGIRIYKCMVFALIVCITFYGFAGVYFHKLNSAGVVPVQNKTTWSILASRYKHDGAKVLRIKHDHSIAYNCTKEIAKLSAEKAAQDDPRLIYAIKRCYLEVPSSLPYELENPDRQDYSQGGQSKYVDDLLNHTVSCSYFDHKSNNNNFISRVKHIWHEFQSNI